MAKQQNITLDGIITEASGRGIFIVELENGHTVTCTSSGKMRQNYIKIIPGDKVQVEISPYDLTKGRISRRCYNCRFYKENEIIVGFGICKLTGRRLRSSSNSCDNFNNKFYVSRGRHN